MSRRTVLAVYRPDIWRGLSIYTKADKGHSIVLFICMVSCYAIGPRPEHEVDDIGS